MTGYWDEDIPVKADNKLVKATFYEGLEEHIIAVANWSEKDQSCSLEINWDKLGMDRSACIYIIPSIPGFQDQQALTALNNITIPGKKGFLIVLQKKDRSSG